MLRRWPTLLTVVIALLLACLGGCAARRTPAQPDPLGAVPSDFTLDVAVVSGGKSEVEKSQGGEGVPAELRNGRFVLFPTGELHYAARRAVDSAPSRPPLVRTLSRDDLARLWAVCGEAGLTSAPPMMFDESAVASPAEGEVTYVLALQADGRYRGVKVTLPRAEVGSSLESAVVRELASLAWANELPAERMMVIPKRYDFGPDPYARYRKP